MEFYDEKTTTRVIFISSKLYFNLLDMGFTNIIDDYCDMRDVNIINVINIENETKEELKELISLCNNTFENQEANTIKLDYTI